MKYCFNCGKKINSRAGYCYYCGEWVGNDEQDELPDIKIPRIKQTKSKYKEPIIISQTFINKSSFWKIIIFIIFLILMIIIINISSNNGNFATQSSTTNNIFTTTHSQTTYGLGGQQTTTTTCPFWNRNC